MINALADLEGCVIIGGKVTVNIRVADDITGIAREKNELKTPPDRFDKTTKEPPWNSL